MLPWHTVSKRKYNIWMNVYYVWKIEQKCSITFDDAYILQFRLSYMLLLIAKCVCINI